MKLNNLVILFLFLTACAGITPAQTTGLAVAGGVAVKQAVDKVKETLPQYQKILKLPTIELCYIEEDDLKCTLTTSDGTKNYGKWTKFISKHYEETIFVKKESIYELLAWINTYCNYDVLDTICKFDLTSYKDIKKVLIYEEATTD